MTPFTFSEISWRSVSMAGPSKRRRQRPFDQDPGDVSLVVCRCMDAAGRLDQLLGGVSDLRHGGFSDFVADEQLGRRTGIDRRFADATKCQPDMAALVFLSEGDHRGHAGDSEVAASSCNFHEAGSGAWLG